MSYLNRQTLMSAAPIAAAVLIMIPSCYYQGKWSERWGEFPELQIFAQQLNKIPMQVGEWTGKEATGSDEQTLKAAGAVDELVRTYENPAGEQVRISIICARHRDIFYHTPDRCYPAAGFEMQSEPQREVFEIGDKHADFFTTTFLKSEPTGTHSERGYWAWTADGTWKAPTNEKLEFAGERALLKLYVFGNVGGSSKGRTSDHDFCSDFIRAFVPACEIALRPAVEKIERVRAGETVNLDPPTKKETAKADAKPAK